MVLSNMKVDREHVLRRYDMLFHTSVPSFSRYYESKLSLTEQALESDLITAVESHTP